MSLVGGMATWALDSFTTYLHEDTTAIHKITLTIDAVRNLETNLYSYSRASMLWKDTQDRSYLFERNEMFLKVNKALLDVRELVHSQESRKVLKDLEEKTTFYFKTRLELENAGSKSGKIANEMAP